MIVTTESRHFLLTHPRYRKHDTAVLHSEAQRYVRNKLVVNSREFAVALLLSRDELRDFCAKHPSVRDERTEWRDLRPVPSRFFVKANAPIPA